MMKGDHKDFPVPVHQADTILDQANPVQHTWYTILDTTPNCRLIVANVAVQVADETLEIRITVDGHVYAGSKAATAGSDYSTVWGDGVIVSVITLQGATSQYRSYGFLVEGRAIKVEVRKTTALGAGNLQGRVVHAKW